MILGVIFMASGIVKIPTLTSFELYVFSFGLASFDICAIASRLLIAFEVSLGLWLFSGVLRKWADLACAAVLLAFSAFLVSRIVVGDNSSCHCFGELVDMKPAWSLVKNGVLAGLLALGWKADTDAGLKGWHILLAGALVAATVFIANPTDAHFRSRSVQTEISPSEWEGFAAEQPLEGRQIVCLYSTGCKFCANCIGKVSGIVIHNDIPLDRTYNVFIRMYEDQISEVERFYKEHGNNVASPFTIMEAKPFLKLTNGKMPVVLLCEDARIVKEFDYLTINEKEIVDFLSSSN